MKLVIIGLGAALACGALLAQTLPAPAYTPVTADTATGALRTPTNFWTANQAAISSAISLSDYQPFDADLTAWADAADATARRSLIAAAATTDLVTFASDPAMQSGWDPAVWRTELSLTSAATGDAAGLITGTLPAARLPAFSGDASSSAGASVLTLATVNANVGSFGTATAAPTFTVDGKGRLTAAGSVTITPAWTSVTGKPTTVATSGLTDAVATSRTISTTAPLTGGGDLSANRTLGVSSATDAAVGVVELATSAEAITGTDPARAMTPSADRAALTAYVDPIAFTRAPLPWIALSDGATTNRRIEWALGSAGNVASSPISEVGHIFRVPAANPTADVGIVIIGGAATPVFSNALWIRLTTSGALQLRMGGALSTDFRSLTYSAFRSDYAGALVRLDAVFTPGTSNPAVYLTALAASGTPTGPAKDITASFTESTGGTVPGWMSTLTATYRHCGYQMPPGEFRHGALINRALTAAEVAQMVQAASPLPHDRIGGSMIPIYASDFSAGVDGWSAAGSASLANAGGRLEVTVSSSTAGALRTLSSALWQAGRLYRLTFTHRLKSGSTGAWQVRDGASSSNWQVLSGNAQFTPTGTDATHTLDVLVLGGVSVYLSRSSAAGEVVEITDFDVQPLGWVVQSASTGTSQLRDLGPNRIHGQATSGIRILSTEDMRPVEFTLTTSGAFVTGASTNPLFYEGAVIWRAEAYADTAGADITLRNNSSSTNDIVTAATDIPTANVWTPLTLIDAQRVFTAGATIWGSSSAGTIRVRLFPTRN